MSTQPTLLVLAAGIGSRYGGIKQIDDFGPSGETIIDYSIFDAINAGFGKIVFIIRDEIKKPFQEIFEKKLNGRIAYDYVYQEITSLLPDGFDASLRKKPWGTGHAVLCARQHIDGPFAVINADDFYGAAAFHTLAHFFKTDTDPVSHALVGFRIENTLSENGSVSRGVCTQDHDGHLTSVIERTKIYEKKNHIFFDEEGAEEELFPNTLVSMNFWGFKPSIFDKVNPLFYQFLKEKEKDAKAEFYIPTFVNHLLGNKEASFKVLNSVDKWFGVTYQEDKPIVKRAIAAQVDQGKYPKNLWV